MRVLTYAPAPRRRPHRRRLCLPLVLVLREPQPHRTPIMRARVDSSCMLTHARTNASSAASSLPLPSPPSACPSRASATRISHSLMRTHVNNLCACSRMRQRLVGPLLFAASFSSFWLSFKGLSHMQIALPPAHTCWKLMDSLIHARPMCANTSLASLSPLPPSVCPSSPPPASPACESQEPHWNMYEWIEK